jgi:hypothetical protein
MVWEYARIPWEQVSDLAAQGWRLMQIPPMPEMKNLGLGQVQMTGVVLFFMERPAVREITESERLHSPLLAPR